MPIWCKTLVLRQFDIRVGYTTIFSHHRRSYMPTMTRVKDMPFFLKKKNELRVKDMF
jgi:hypothetical protein